MAMPAGYHRLAPGVRCRCIHSRTDENGDSWCCGGKAPGLQRADGQVEPSFFDIDLQILEGLLCLHEHGIRIVRVEASRNRPLEAIAVVITGEDLPPGECRATYRQVGDVVVLENLRAAGETRRRP